MRSNSLHGGIEKIRELATKYDKPPLARMAQMGLVGANEAVMAGMMIDRIAQSAMKPPEQTVAQDVLQPQGPQMQQAPQGVAGLQQSAGEPPMEEAPSQGVAGLPSNLPHMAGGGMVSFAGDEGSLVGGPGNAMSRQVPQQGRPQMRPLQQFALPELPTLQGSMDQEQEAQRMAGVDPNFIANMQKETLAKKGEFEGRKNRAMGDALMMWGAGMIGARQGQEWVTASASAQQSLLGYKSAMDEIKASEKEIDKASRELSLAEHQMKMGRSERALGRVEASKSKLFDAQNKQIEANNAREFQSAQLLVDLYKVDANNANDIAVAQIQKSAPDAKPTEKQNYVNNVQRLMDLAAKATTPEEKDAATKALADYRKNWIDAHGPRKSGGYDPTLLKGALEHNLGGDPSQVGETYNIMERSLQPQGEAAQGGTWGKAVKVPGGR